MATPLSPVQDCTEFVASEGRYELQQDIFLDQVLPHPVIPTHVSSVSVKYKDYFNTSGVSGGRAHGKQVSADSTLSASNIDRLDEHLKDFKLAGERGDGDDEDRRAMSGNFHGNLVDLPLYNDEATGYKTPKSGMMSPGLPQVITPGPPPLKDSTSSNRLSDPFAQYGHPPAMQHQHSLSSKAVSRANSYHLHQQQDDSQSSTATGSSASFSAFFSGKRKKPKNNIAKTNSTFVAKITTHENLAKILANRVNEDVYLFWNTGRTFTWSDLGQKPNEPLSHISFAKAFPSSHDVNVLTRSCDHLDVIIGFSTGDIIWFDPLCNKYYRLNKQFVIKDSAVTMIKWLPGSESQFMAAFHDGSILIMDKERDDNAFTTPTPPSDGFHVTRPKHSKNNPISHWQICKKPITAFAFSPDLQHVAVVAMDGGLRVIDFQQERLLDTFQAYFGALNCVCWSPDGKYILTGGQDDLVTIWSFKDQRIVARCQGHQSYVTGVAFDPWRCDERNYRFGSVGEDAKLLLWDFSVSALHKPKAAAMQRRGSNATVLGTTTSGYRPGHASKGSISSLRGNGGHSLFSGLNKSTSSQIHATLQQQPHIPSTLSEDPQEQSAGSSSVSSSTRNSSVLEAPSGDQLGQTQQQGQQLGENSLSLATDGRPLSSATSSVHSTVVSESGVSSTGTAVPNTTDAPSTNSIYKRSVHARTLPHLHLHKPHFQSGSQVQDSSNHQVSSGTATINGSSSGGHHRHGHGLSSLFRQGNKTQHNHDSATIVRPPEPRSHVAMLQPLMAKAIHQEPLASITFREDAIMTSDRRGHIKVWKRPPPLPHHP